MDDDIKLRVYSSRIALLIIAHLLRPKGPCDESHWPLLTQKSMVAGVVGCTKCTFLQSNIKICHTDTSSPALPISVAQEQNSKGPAQDSLQRDLWGDACFSLQVQPSFGKERQAPLWCWSWIHDKQSALGLGLLQSIREDWWGGVADLPNVGNTLSPNSRGLCCLWFY